MDSYSKYEQIIDAYWSDRGSSNAQQRFYGADGMPMPNFELLEAIVTKSIADGDTAQSGSLAKGLDLWIAEELRAAGFGSEEIWPRLHEPRVVDPSVVRFVDSLPGRLRSDCIERAKAKGSSTANVQGAVYLKQIDVGMSPWLTGPEMLISSKTMSGSYGKNLANRFEEAYGDAMNLRKRFPLASIGFFFLVNAEIAAHPGDLSKAVMMLRKLQDGSEAYDAAALLLVDWSGGKAVVPDQSKLVPASLRVPRFFRKIVDATVLRGAIGAHQTAADKANLASIEF